MLSDIITPSLSVSGSVTKAMLAFRPYLYPPLLVTAGLSASIVPSLSTVPGVSVSRI